MAIFINGENPGGGRNPNTNKQDFFASGSSGGSGGFNTATKAQRPFAPETMYTTSPWVPKIARGYIQRYDAVVDHPVGNKFSFLFNPNQVDVQYSTVQARSGANQDPAGNAGGGGGPSSVGVHFALLIDRSFEVAYHGDSEGVTHDVECLELMLGMDATTPYMSEGNVMKFVLATRLTFYGWVSGMAVSYLYFNQDMIPMRCSIDINTTIYPIRMPVRESLTAPRPAAKRKTRSRR